LQIAAMQRELDDWFERHRRGRGCRIFIYPEADRVWFLVRHASPWRREGSIENGKPTCVLYRPEKHDVLVYEQTIGELRMNAEVKGEKKLYRECFGRHLFGSADFFGGSGKYTLEPLRADGEKALACGEVPEIESIKLCEIHYYWPGETPETEIRKSEDVFKVLRARGACMPERPQIVQAVFEIKFHGSRTPRKATVRTHNSSLSRDDDGVFIEKWLAARGFVLDQCADSASRANKALEVLVGH
jgi:hypothetical protein